MFNNNDYPNFSGNCVTPEQGAADQAQNLPTLIEICKAVSAGTGSADEFKDGLKEQPPAAEFGAREAKLAEHKSENVEGSLTLSSLYII